MHLQLLLISDNIKLNEVTALHHLEGKRQAPNLILADSPVSNRQRYTMSVLRSPTGSGISGSRSDSQPNLSSCTKLPEYSEFSVAHPSKRKTSDDNACIRQEIAELRTQTSQIMSILTSLRDNQQEFIEKINQDVNDIKKQISDIKVTTDNLTTELNNMKSHISDIVGKNLAAESRMNSLESEIQQLKANPTQFLTEPNYEDILNEIKERESRSKNIIINGIREAESSDKDQRKNLDTKEVVKIIKQISEDFPSPQKIFRLGKYQSNRNRPLKVCFNSYETVKSILRAKNKVSTDSISIYSDQTPQQRKYLRHLKEQLKNQIDTGKNNLTIKFIKNVPRIVEMSPKN